MLEHAKQFVDKRLFNLSIPERMKFYLSLEELAKSPDNTMGMLQMSELAKETMNGALLDGNSQSLIADLVLIGVDTNQQHVRAVASNYRRKTIMKSLPESTTGELVSTTVPVLPSSSTLGCSSGESRTAIRLLSDQPSTSVNEATMSGTTSNIVTDQVMAAASFLNEALGNNRIQMEMDMCVEDFLSAHNLTKVVTKSDGHCLLHAWSASTRQPYTAIKQLLMTEFNNNLSHYTSAGIDRNEFENYINLGRYTFNAADTIVDLLCNATGHTAIIIGKKYVYHAPGRSTMLPGITEITRVGDPGASALRIPVLLLKSGEHYESLV